jgi:hypothetical protein
VEGQTSVQFGEFLENQSSQEQKRCKLPRARLVDERGTIRVVWGDFGGQWKRMKGVDPGELGGGK